MTRQFKLALVLMSILSTKIVISQEVLFDVILPKGVPIHSTDLYLAGDFNGWHTADTAFQLKKMPDGHYKTRIQLKPGNYAFKVVRGDWNRVEVKKNGHSLDNRHVIVKDNDPQKSVEIQIANWSDNFEQIKSESTAAKNVKILDTAFNIPQLKRKRRIWIYEPENYSKSKKRYPVLYMQDGQNIFDAATSFSGEWGVDEYLNNMASDQQCLVVAIDNGGNDRMLEYNPFNNRKFGKGEGKAYAEFLATTLKPYIDKHYRTKPAPRYTSIAGSSMGGLISFYTAVTYPEVFGNAGIFSPSFWIAPKIYVYAKAQLSKLTHSAFYFYGGGQESSTLMSEIQKMQNILHEEAGLWQSSSFADDGTHNEKAWQKEFPKFYSWLLKQ